MTSLTTDRSQDSCRTSSTAMGVTLDVDGRRDADGMRIESRGRRRRSARAPQRRRRSRRCSTSSTRRSASSSATTAASSSTATASARTRTRSCSRWRTSSPRRRESTGVPQEMGPLNPYERRIVHLDRRRRSDVTSESIGDAFMKTVIISRSNSEVRLRLVRRCRSSGRPPSCDVRSTDDTIVAIATPPGRGGDRRRAAQRAARRRDRRGAHATAAIARAAARDADAHRTRADDASRSIASRRHALSRAAFLHRRRRRRDQRARQSRRAARDRRARRSRPARGWPSPGEFTLRAFLNGGSISFRRKRSRDLIDAGRRCRRASRSISSTAR